MMRCGSSDFEFVFIEELPEDWNHVSDMQFFRSLDRSFLFPGKIPYFFGT